MELILFTNWSLDFTNIFPRRIYPVKEEERLTCPPPSAGGYCVGEIFFYKTKSDLRFCEKPICFEYI